MLTIIDQSRVLYTHSVMTTYEHSTGFRLSTRLQQFKITTRTRIIQSEKKSQQLILLISQFTTNVMHTLGSILEGRA